MIGEKIKKLLEMHGMKAATLSAKTGIPKSTIYSIINRNNKNVDYSIMEKIADALDVPVEYFFDRSENKIIEPQEDSPEKKLLVFFYALNDDGKAKLIEYADDLVSSGKYKKDSVAAS